MPDKLITKIEQKTFSFEIKSVDPDLGIVTGYLSAFNNVDTQKDRVRPGAFRKTIAEAIQRKDKRSKKYLWPMLWMHDPEKPIGGFTDAIEDNYGLLVTAQLDISTNQAGIPNNPLATTVFSGYKAGYIDEMSIGYQALQKSYDQGGVRDLTEIRLFEGSAVTSLFAANDQAIATSVKTLASGLADKKETNMPPKEKKDFQDHYREEALESWLNQELFDIFQALRSSLLDIFLIGDQPQADLVDLIINNSPANASGLTDILKQWVQKGIDLNASNYLPEMWQDGDNGQVNYGYSPLDYMSRRKPVSTKAARGISGANASMLQNHIDTLNTLAIQHKMAVKAIGGISDDLSQIVGVIPPFTDPGTDPNQTQAGAGTSKTLEPQDIALTKQPLQSTEEYEDIAQFAEWLKTQLAK